MKGIIHWVSAAHAYEAEVRLYDHLFREPIPLDGSEGEEWVNKLNPDSLVIKRGCRLEASLATASPGQRFQFERLGYFVADSVDSKPGAPVFNRSVSLRDSWARIEKKAGK